MLVLSSSLRRELSQCRNTFINRCVPQSQNAVNPEVVCMACFSRDCWCRRHLRGSIRSSIIQLRYGSQVNTAVEVSITVFLRIRDITNHSGHVPETFRSHGSIQLGWYW